MKKNVFWLILSCLLALSLVLASCGTKTIPTTTPTTTPTLTPTTMTTTKTTAVPATTPTTTPTSTTVTGVPKYGGTITVRSKVDVAHFDSYFYGTSFAGDGIQSFYDETLGTINWALDRNVWDFKTRVRPTQYRTGLLAESYEQPDLQTVIFHLHKGIRYQNKAPLNGREFTADDVVYHYNRERGLGSGFTKPSPYRNHAQYAPMTSVTAIDKYTVVFKWQAPSLDMLDSLLDDFGFANIVPKEVVDLYGNMEDWHHAVGTGPFILQDYVSGSSVEFIKNPDYWGFDSRYPKNQLPYVDKVKVLILPDDATTLAALRLVRLILQGQGHQRVTLFLLIR